MIVVFVLCVGHSYHVLVTQFIHIYFYLIAKQVLAWKSMNASEREEICVLSMVHHHRGYGGDCYPSVTRCRPGSLYVTKPYCCDCAWILHVSDRQKQGPVPLHSVEI